MGYGLSIILYIPVKTRRNLIILYILCIPVKTPLDTTNTNVYPNTI